MNNKDTAFTTLVANALGASLEHFSNAHPERVLRGLALGTDDDLTTLFVAFADQAFFTNPPYPGAEFIFVEWPFGDESGAFDASQGELSRRFQAAESAGYDAHIAAHVNSAFTCLVDALKTLRAKRLIGDDVLLVVGSTDPSEDSRERYLSAAEALNSRELFAQFMAVQ